MAQKEQYPELLKILLIKKNLFFLINYFRLAKQRSYDSQPIIFVQNGCEDGTFLVFSRFISNR